MILTTFCSKLTRVYVYQ